MPARTSANDSPRIIGHDGQFIAIRWGSPQSRRSRHDERLPKFFEICLDNLLCWTFSPPFTHRGSLFKPAGKRIAVGFSIAGKRLSEHVQIVSGCRRSGHDLCHLLVKLGLEGGDRLAVRQPCRRLRTAAATGDKHHQGNPQDSGHRPFPSDVISSLAHPLCGSLQFRFCSPYHQVTVLKSFHRPWKASGRRWLDRCCHSAWPSNHRSSPP